MYTFKQVRDQFFEPAGDGVHELKEGYMVFAYDYLVKAIQDAPDPEQGIVLIYFETATSRTEYEDRAVFRVFKVEEV